MFKQEEVHYDIAVIVVICPGHMPRFGQLREKILNAHQAEVEQPWRDNCVPESCWNCLCFGSCSVWWVLKWIVGNLVKLPVAVK